jgi:hypothetical protein
MDCQYYGIIKDEIHKESPYDLYSKGNVDASECEGFNQKSPNLRNAECCVNCRHGGNRYNLWGCDKHNHIVDKYQVCDDFKW